MKLSVKHEGSNYTARVVKLPAPRPHPNANKLQLVTLAGDTVITGMDAKEGATYIYFPVECSINRDYLHWSNSFASANLNADVEKKGFFSDSGRVKAIRLRGMPSQGYIVPASNIADWLKSRGVAVSEFPIGAEFDDIEGLEICKKYVNAAALQRQLNAERAAKNRGGKVKRTPKIIDNQFRFHGDTKQLKYGLDRVTPDSTVAITYKLHGTSGVFSKVLCNRKLSLVEKIAKFLGASIQQTQYDYVWSSRRVIKSARYLEEEKYHVHFYDSDVWSLAAQTINPLLRDGMTVYCELVGQTPTGSWIQHQYDYGTEPKKMDVYVYRITHTDPAGNVLEYTLNQIKQFCDLTGLKMVPIMFYGKAKDIFPELSTETHWHNNLLAKLKEKYNEKDCYMCKNKVPEEGVVLTLESGYFEAYKLKSFRFLEKETADLDAGTVTMEDAESAEVSAS